MQGLKPGILKGGGLLFWLHLIQFAIGGRVSGADPDCKEQGYLDGGGWVGVGWSGSVWCGAGVLRVWSLDLQHWPPPESC